MSERIEVSMHDAKSRLSHLAERAWCGDRVVITKAGKPYVNLLPHRDTPQARKPGRLMGKIRISADFDKTHEDLMDGFEDSL